MASGTIDRNWFANQRTDIFYEKKITFRRCAKFFPSEKDPQVCGGCGYASSQHGFVPRREVKPWTRDVTKWRQTLCMYNIENNFEGHLRMCNELANIERLVPFCVIADNTHPRTLVDGYMLNEEKFNLKLPEIAISVVGDHHYPVFESERVQERFQRGLLKAVTCTQVWIVTGGTCYGADDVISSTLSDHVALEFLGLSSPTFTLIGLCNWTSFVDHQQVNAMLLKKSLKRISLYDPAFLQQMDLQAEMEGYDENEPYYYESSNVKTVPRFSRNYPQHLNVYSQVLVGVDSGKYLDEGGLHRFRESLDLLLYERHHVPTVVLAIGGTASAFARIARSVRNGVAVVLCLGSGGATDIICHSMRMFKDPRKPPDADKLKALASRIELELLPHKDTSRLVHEDHLQMEAYLRDIEAVCRDRSLVEVCDLTTKHGNVDVSILNAILKMESEQCDKLQLAMVWNQCNDTVAGLLESQADINAMGSMSEKLLFAVKNELCDFISMFLEFGLNIVEFVTPEFMSKLYQHSVDTYPPFSKLAHHAKGVNSDITLEGIYQIIYSSTSVRPELSYVTMKSSKGDGNEDVVGFRDPFRELALWALFTNKKESFDYYAAKTQNRVILYLLFSELWKVHSHALPSYDEEERDQMKEYEDQCNQTALDIINEMDREDRLLAADVVQHLEPSLGYKSSIDLAAFCEAKTILATNCIQAVMDNRWKNHLEGDFVDFFLGILFPVKVLGFKLTDSKVMPEVNIDQMIGESEEHAPDGSCADFEEPEEGDNCKKLKRFYRAPIFKFITHSFAYLCFLLLFSYYYIRIVQDEHDPLADVCFVFNICYAVEAFRQLLDIDAPWSLKLALWSKSEWNLIELTYLSSVMAAYLLHLFDHLHQDMFLMGQMLYCIGCFLMWLRLLRFYQPSSKQGPIWIFIRKMLKETVIFFSIFFVMVIGFGMLMATVSVPDFDHPRDDIEIGSFDTRDWILLKAYFMFFGEMFIDGIAHETNKNPNLAMCALLLLLFVGNALILNLLVALYGSVFGEVQETSATEWKNEMFWVLLEYERKTYIPPPFSIFESVIRFFLHFTGRKAKRSPTEGKDLRLLSEFEQHCANNLLERRAREVSTEQVIEKLNQVEEMQRNGITEADSVLRYCRKLFQSRKQQLAQEKADRVKSARQPPKHKTATLPPDIKSSRTNLSPSAVEETLREMGEFQAEVHSNQTDC